MAQLEAIAADVPDALAALCRAWGDLYWRMAGWAELPLTLIHAVLDGYCQQRILTAAEHACIPDAVRFGIADLGTRHFATALQRGIQEDIFMQKTQARWAASDGIISIANDFLS